MTHAIFTERLTKYYGKRCVVNSLGLRVPTGSVYGFLGRNGAGKSTTIKMLTGMVQPNYGRVELLGYELGTLPDAVRGRIAYLAEGHPLYGWMTAAEAARADDARLRDAVLLARAHGRSWNHIALALGVSRQAARQRFASKASV